MRQLLLSVYVGFSRLDNLLTAVVAICGYVMATMRFTAGRIDRQRRIFQGIMRPTHATR